MCTPGTRCSTTEPADAAEPAPTTDVLPYVPVPGAGAPAVTRLDGGEQDHATQSTAPSPGPRPRATNPRCG